jgi:SWI/SNF-related matrix-associated actin-dependent regulator 1 of chromatin subfamily A
MGYWDFSGSSNLHQLYDETKEQIIRKKKEDCLDLPPKIYNKIYLQLSKKEQAEYNAVFDRYIKFLREEKLANLEFYEADRKIRNIIYTQSLVEIGLMKQLTSKFKLPVVISRMEDILEEDDSRKIIIFSQYNETINLLVNHFGERCVKLTGSMNGNQREESVERFQNDKDVRVFVGNIQAAGVGITLTSGDTVMFADMAWTPADHDQAESRPHRIGQKNNVNIFYFITENTIEEKIYDLLETKRNIEKQVIDGQIIEEPTGNDGVLSNLIESLI